MAGKGDKPRSCYSNNFKQNYDNIKWNDKPLIVPAKVKKVKSGKTIYVY